MFSDHGSLTAGFQGNLRNVIVRKRHSGFEEFIFFAILVTILNLMKNEKRNELTLMNGENDANSMRANQKWPKKNVYNVILDGFVSLVYTYISPLFLSPFEHIYLFRVLKFIWLSNTQITFRDCRVHLFPTTYMQTAAYILQCKEKLSVVSLLCWPKFAILWQNKTYIVHVCVV